MASEQAKVVLKRIQEELALCQDKVDSRLRGCRDSRSFYDYLKANKDGLNIIDVEFIDIKCGHYGRLIKTVLMIPYDGRLFVETAYYPLSKTYFRKKRIAISNKFAISNHYMERLIERKSLDSVQTIKAAIDSFFHSFDTSRFVQEFGGLDISTAFILIRPYEVSFCDLEYGDDYACEAVMKTILTENELSTKKKAMIDYILSALNTESCFLATFDLPCTFSEADRIIEDTRIRTAGGGITFEEKQYFSHLGASKFNIEKKSIKAFVKYLETYDPNSKHYQGV